MESTSCTEGRTSRPPQWYPGIWQKSPMRLEPGSPEEAKILEIESQISKARENGAPVDALIEERNRICHLWIERLDRDISVEQNEEKRGWLRQQRERAIRDYKP